MKINNFRGELTDISAKQEALVSMSVERVRTTPYVHVSPSSGRNESVLCPVSVRMSIQKSCR